VSGRITRDQQSHAAIAGGVLLALLIIGLMLFAAALYN
jgi:hypothetical protein